MQRLFAPCLLLAVAPFHSGCGDGHAHDDDDGHAQGAEPADEEAHEEDGAEEDHEHAETPIGTITVGELSVELAQGHGAVAAGEEAHLVVKLPYSDGGATIVRAWLGTPDRTLSYVGLGEYAASHDDYDIHATAPDPLPADVLWHVELERPDGTRLVGSGKPLL